MVCCVALNCHNYNYKKTQKTFGRADDRKLSFHEFPRDEQLRTAWTKNVSRANWKPSARSALCSNHFTRDCFVTTKELKIKRLKKGSVPTIFDGSAPDSQGLEPQTKNAVEGKEESRTAIDIIDTMSDRLEVDGGQHVCPFSYSSSTPNKFSATLDSFLPSEREPVLQVTAQGRKPRRRRRRKKRRLDTAVVVLDHGYTDGSSVDDLACKVEKLRQRNDLLSVRLKRTIAIRDNTAKKVQNMKATIEYLRESNKFLESVSNPLSITPTEENPSVSVARYSPEIRKFAMTLAFHSTSAYEYVRRTFNESLPNMRSIRRWCKKIKQSATHPPPEDVVYMSVDDFMKELDVGPQQNDATEDLNGWVGSTDLGCLK